MHEYYILVHPTKTQISLYHIIASHRKPVDLSFLHNITKKDMLVYRINMFTHYSTFLKTVLRCVILTRKERHEKRSSSAGPLFHMDFSNLSHSLPSCFSVWPTDCSLIPEKVLVSFWVLTCSMYILSSLLYVV